MSDAFRAHAAKQTTETLNRIAEIHSKRSRHELEAVRRAFTSAFETLEAALAAPLDASKDVAALVEDLAAKAGTEASAKADRARKEHDAQVAEHGRQLDALRKQLAEVDAARTQQASEIEELHAAAAAAQAELEAARSEQAMIEQDLRTAEARATSVSAELQAVQQLADAAAENIAAASAGKAELEAELQRLEAARDGDVNQQAALERDLAAARADAEQAVAELTRLTAHFEGALDEMRHDHAAAMRDQQVASAALPLTGLLNVFHALDTAASVGDVLTTLVGGLAREFSRVALFRVQGNRLEGMQQAGFEFDRDISKLVFPLTVDSMLTRAAASARMESVIAPPETTAALVPFGGTPSCALALPIAIHGETLAVIYADDADRMEGAAVAPQLPAQFAELLFHHAQLVLLRIATEQKTLTELREYATMLVNEIEYGYNSDLDAGRTHAECVNRLKDALECTRRIYSQRVAGEKPATEALLDERLAAVVEARAKTPFGRDLASLVQTDTGAKGAARNAKAG